MAVSRRNFLGRLAVAGVASRLPLASHASAAVTPADTAMTCPFRLAVINDEISPDFDHACSVASQDFGLKWIELRSMWNKNVTDAQCERNRQTPARFSPNTTCASPTSPARSSRRIGPARRYPKRAPAATSSTPTSTSNNRTRCLTDCIELAKAFKTDRIRCFDFWRLDDQKPYRAAINDKLPRSRANLRQEQHDPAARKRDGLQHGHRRRSRRDAESDPEPNFMLNWDPGNAAHIPRQHALPRRLQCCCPNTASATATARTSTRKPDGK